MSEANTGTQSHKTEGENPQVNSKPGASRPPYVGLDVETQELTPDLPPQPVEAGEGEHRAKRPRGFAAMDRKLVSEIARKGGKAAHSAGTAHEFTSEEARVAGRKGGRATHAKRRKVGEDQSDQG
jgi:general stress protein YciG